MLLGHLHREVVLCVLLYTLRSIIICLLMLIGVCLIFFNFEFNVSMRWICLVWGHPWLAHICSMTITWVLHVLLYSNRLCQIVFVIWGFAIISSFSIQLRCRIRPLIRRHSNLYLNGLLIRVNYLLIWNKFIITIIHFRVVL